MLRAAELIAEGMRYLNYATAPGAGGLENPGDVYSLLGALGDVPGRMPQLLGQIAAWLQDESAAGRIGIDRGSVTEAVAEVCMALSEATMAAGRVRAGLDRAHQATAIMSGKEGNGA
jgi:hypothetical protein